jgi:putative transposase
MKKDDIDFFDSKAEFSVVQRRLPHWMQSGTLCFVTWRAADSLPDAVLQRIDNEIADLLRRFDLDPLSQWKDQLSKRSTSDRANFYRKLLITRDKYLDQGHGRCLLANQECAIQVEQALLHFDNQRYFMTDLVVMPNHVHFIAAFRDEQTFLKQCTDWKRYTARQINRLCQGSGQFWQVDQFDHLIRHAGAFEYFRKYIAENPKNAGLNDGQFRCFSKEM